MSRPVGKPLIESLFPTCETTVPKNPPAPEPRPVGRPRTNPDGTKVRGFRVTDSEWAALKAHLAKLRRRAK